MEKFPRKSKARSTKYKVGVRAQGSALDSKARFDHIITLEPDNGTLVEGDARPYYCETSKFTQRLAQAVEDGNGAEPLPTVALVS